MKIIVGAVPGAGKTTILKLVKKKMPGARIVNVGDLILELASKKMRISRDELRKKLSLEQQREFQEEAYKKIARMRSKLIFIDTHLCIKTPKGYFPGVSEETARLIKPEMIILLEFKPKDIIQRRLRDPTRKRELESEEEIDEHQRFNRQFAISAASSVQAAVEIIDLRFKEKKPFEHAEKAAEEIVKLVKK